MKTKSNIIITACCFCKVIIGTKDARDSKGGLSHTECDVCHPLNLERIRLQKELWKLSSGRLVAHIDRCNKIINRVELINRILSFRKYAVEFNVRGPAIRLAMGGVE